MSGFRARHTLDVGSIPKGKATMQRRVDCMIVRRKNQGPVHIPRIPHHVGPAIPWIVQIADVPLAAGIGERRTTILRLSVREIGSGGSGIMIESGD